MDFQVHGVAERWQRQVPRGAPKCAEMRCRIGTTQLRKHCKRDQPELTRHTLEALRQPLEDGTITIARARSTVCFPTSFPLVAAGLWRDALWADPTSLDRSRLDPQAQRPVPRGQAQGSSP